VRHHGSAALVDRHVAIDPASAARTTCRAVSNTVGVTTIERAFLSMVRSIFLRIRRSTTRMRPRTDVPPEWAPLAGFAVTLNLRVIRRGIDNEHWLCRYLPSFCSPERMSMGFRNASERACRLARSAGSPLKGLIPMGDCSTSRLVRIADPIRSTYYLEAEDRGGIDIVFASTRNSVPSWPMVSGWIREA
jgi:hypothetical protein